MSGVTFACPDLATFCRLEGGLEVTANLGPSEPTVRRMEDRGLQALRRGLAGLTQREDEPQSVPEIHCSPREEPATSSSRRPPRATGRQPARLIAPREELMPTAAIATVVPM